MKLAKNINSILEQDYYYVTKLDPISLSNIKYSTILSRRRYERALELIDIEKTEIQKNEALQIINNAINSMKENHIPLLIDNYIFAIGYPESYDLIIPYYDTLYDTCANNKRFTGIYNGQIGVFRNNRADLKNRIDYLRQATTTLFSPLLITKDLEKLQKELDINVNDLRKMLNSYKKLKVFTNNTYSDTDIANRIKQEILNETTLEVIAKKYHMNQDAIHRLLQTALSETEYREILDRLRFNSAKRYNSMQNTIETLMDLIPNGITINEGKTIKFNMLDYYSICPLNPKTIIENLKLLTTTSREQGVKRAKVKSFLSANSNQGPNVNIEYFQRNKVKLITSNGEFDMLDYFEQIHEEFEKNNIPSYAKLYQTALSRISRNQPILPLKAKEEVKEESRSL